MPKSGRRWQVQCPCRYRDRQHLRRWQPRRAPTRAQAYGDLQDGQDESNRQQLTSSSFPDEAVDGTSVSGPPPIDHRAHQVLLRKIALNRKLSNRRT
ncbi:unnamed protein product [Caretta caretta]